MRHKLSEHTVILTLDLTTQLPADRWAGRMHTEHTGQGASHVLNETVYDTVTLHLIIWNGRHLKTYGLFILGIFCLIFLDHG